MPVGALLPYCLAEVAATFLGTITVRAEIIAALVAEICRGLARSAFRRTLIVSGHAEEEDSEGQRPRRALPLSRLLKRLSPRRGESGIVLAVAIPDRRGLWRTGKLRSGHSGRDSWSQ